jgi:hypothetical protein
MLAAFRGETMRKLPVFATYGHALGFAFSNYFTVLRLAWLPLTAYIIATFVLGDVASRVMIDEMLKSGRPDPGFMFRHWDQFAILWCAMMALQVIAFAAVAVAIHRVVLFGDRKPGEYFAFAFGATELRFVAMVALSVFAVLAVMAAILTPIVLLLSNGDIPGFFAQFENWPQNMPTLAQSGAFGALMTGYIIGWLLLLYFFLRFALWPPTVVATGRLALGEAWALTRGNALRILGLFMLVAVTIWIVVVPIMVAVALIGLPIAIDQAEALKKMSEPEAIRMMQDRFTLFNPLFWLVYLAIYVLLTGLGVALLSYSYKALKGVDPNAPITDAS